MKFNKKNNTNYNCLICDKGNISYKLYGMPDVGVIDKLKNFGVNVQIMGCVPPYADVKTYLFQCKKCKHEWFEYEEIEESFFEFIYETYPGQASPKIIYESGFITLEQSEGYSYLRIPNKKETELFWKKIDEFDVWSWEKEYSKDDVLDGFGWELLIKKIGKKEKRIFGFNSYPGNEKFFNNFLKCIKDFTNWDFKF